jgi:class 3 adenylate cyclase
MRTCPSCGRENAEDARYCSYCATSLEPAARAREERKVVTCLFCDLVGFTARAERMDPEDVRRLLQPYHARVRSELERYGGTVEKFIGDAVMAIFGAPVAHEDDPERAVRAALAIRDVLTEDGELEVRIGITTGEALVALGARPEAGEGMASGDVVNTAARLQGAAPVNGILVDEKTYRATERVIAYSAAPAVDAKGKTAPVEAWEAREANARFGVDVRQLGATHLIGREDELGTLVAALDRARREHEPQLVTLVGVPGIGKSRLLWELFQHVDAERELTNWRQGRSLPYGEGVSFWALAEIVKAQAGILETDSSGQAEAKLGTSVGAVAGQDDPRWLERHLRPLVGLEAGDTIENRRTEVFAAWRRFLELLAEQRPLVLVFEDLHWADDALLDFVDHLVDWARGVPLLVVGTARPELLERRPGWGGGKPNAATISLRPLSDEQTAELVHTLLATPVLDANAQAKLLVHAGGNPLYAEEFARLVAEGRSPDELPESVQGLIAARVDGLGEEEKALLRAAAVVGRVFWLGSVTAVSDTPRWTAEELLHGLERKEFVRRERRSSVAGEAEYAFRHPLVQDVAYGQIPRAERAERHVRAARWIESLGRPEDHAEMLAHHYLAALDLARAAGTDVTELTSKVRAAARGAGDRALALNAFPAAARFYSRALELAPSRDSDRPELLLRLGRALHHSGEDRAESVLEEATRELVAAGRTDLAAEAHSTLNEVWWHRGRRDRSQEHLARALELLGSEESDARAHVLSRVARVKVMAGESEDALRASREALPLAERLGLDELRVHVLVTVGTARFGLGDAGGLDDLEHAIEIGEAIGSSQIANALNNLGFMRTLVGDVPGDRKLRDDAIRAGERFGDERIVRFARLCLPMLDYYLGDWDQALSASNRALEEIEAGEPHYLEANIRWTRALLRAARGDVDAASSDALRAVQAARDAKDPQMILPALAVQLRLELDSGRITEALHIAGELLAQQPRHAAVAPAIELAWAAERLENAEAARAWVGGIPYASRWSDAALAILDGAFERAAAVFADIGSLPDEAEARLHAADAGNIRRALAFYRSVGATRFIRQAEALLGEESEVSA